jgi:arabinan endo-1,5-alpha-L-arabinosidase
MMLLSLFSVTPSAGQVGRTYSNPVIHENCPDPSDIKAPDGYYYVYSTQDNLPGDTQYLPIHRSRDLVHWEKVGTVFNDYDRPRWVSTARLWAPDINLIDGKYVLYYAMGVWGGTYQSAIGVAVADNPAGPFTDHGKVLDYASEGVNNSIDEFYIEDRGHKYLVWGSFFGIYAVELTDDGLAVKKRSEEGAVGGQPDGGILHREARRIFLFDRFFGDLLRGQQKHLSPDHGKVQKCVGTLYHPGG